MNPLHPNSSQCSPSPHKWTYVFLIPLPLLSGLINVIVWLAATFYRKKLLRQSYVYSCVTSTLLSNALFLSFHLWDEIAGFQMPDMVAMMMNISSKPVVSIEMQTLWSLCTAATIAMLFVACGNLAVLIYVMLDSAYFRKSVRQRLSSSQQGKSRTSATELEAKRRRAAFLIAFVWLLPIALTLAAVVDWHCADKCVCPPGADGELCPHELGCSRIWYPMSNSFVAVNVGLWLAEVIVLCFVTISGIQKFQAYNFPTKRSTMSLEGSPVFRKSATSSIWLPSTATATTTVTEEGGIRTSHPKGPADVDDDVFTSQAKPKPKRQRLMISPRLRLVCYLTITFIVCSLLIPVAFFVDIIATPLPPIGLRFASMVLIQVYTLVCPILLVSHLSNLKIALARMASSLHRFVGCGWCIKIKKNPRYKSKR